MPLPIETSAPKASALIQRFQQNIDSSTDNAAPLIPRPRSSFGSSAPAPAVESAEVCPAAWREALTNRRKSGQHAVGSGGAAVPVTEVPWKKGAATLSPPKVDQSVNGDKENARSASEPPPTTSDGDRSLKSTPVTVSTDTTAVEDVKASKATGSEAPASPPLQAVSVPNLSLPSSPPPSAKLSSAPFPPIAVSVEPEDGGPAHEHETPAPASATGDRSLDSMLSEAEAQVGLDRSSANPVPLSPSTSSRLVSQSPETSFEGRPTSVSPEAKPPRAPMTSDVRPRKRKESHLMAPTAASLAKIKPPIGTSSTGASPISATSPTANRIKSPVAQRKPTLPPTTASRASSTSDSNLPTSRSTPNLSAPKGLRSFINPSSTGSGPPSVASNAQRTPSRQQINRSKTPSTAPPASRTDRSASITSTASSATVTSQGAARKVSTGVRAPPPPFGAGPGLRKPSATAAAQGAKAATEMLSPPARKGPKGSAGPGARKGATSPSGSPVRTRTLAGVGKAKVDSTAKAPAEVAEECSSATEDSTVPPIQETPEDDLEPTSTQTQTPLLAVTEADTSMAGSAEEFGDVSDARSEAGSVVVGSIPDEEAYGGVEVDDGNGEEEEHAEKAAVTVTA